MTELITALQSTDGLIAIALIAIAIIAYLVYAFGVRNPYIPVIATIILIAGGIVLLYASGVIVFDWAAWNTAPAAIPAA